MERIGVQLVAGMEGFIPSTAPAWALHRPRSAPSRGHNEVRTCRGHQGLVCRLSRQAIVS
jgi:hypothetical protein